MSRDVPRALGLTLAAVACAREQAAVTDTATTGSRAPSAYVSEIPPWPSEKSEFATDRTGAFPAALRAQVPACTDATPRIVGDSVGRIYPGQPLPILLGTCSHPLLLWHWDDGQYLPAAAVRLGAALVVADLGGMTADDVVSRVVVVEGAHTAEDIGLNSSLAELGRAYGTPTWRKNQCTVDVSFESRPGLLVRIAVPGGGCGDIRRYAVGNDFSHFPRGSRIQWIAAELGGAR